MTNGSGLGLQAARSILPLFLLTAVETAAAQRTAATPRQDSSAAQAPGTGVWRNYDFVPGDTVWVATDFSTEPVGRFPARQLEFVSGNMQLVEFDGMRALEVSSASVFRIALPRILPQKFSIEFEIRIPAPNIGTNMFFETPAGSVSSYKRDYVYVGGRPGIYRKGLAVSNMYLPRIQDTWVPVKIQVDSAYSIVYVGADRVAQVPTVDFPRGRFLEVHTNGNARLHTYLKDFVVAVGLNDLYKSLATTGEFSTLGILFDSDSDRLRPESTPVLEQIRATMTEHPELRLRIEGHTDSLGTEAHNLSLSERRARAVVAFLVAQGIAGNRLSSAGMGESSPVADNGTASGRRQNRRVVLKKVP